MSKLSCQCDKQIPTHAVHGHDKRCPLLILRVDPIDLGSVSKCLGHVRQTSSTRRPVELQTRAVLFGLVENHLLTGWRGRQRGRHGWRLGSVWRTKGIKRWRSVSRWSCRGACLWDFSCVYFTCFCQAVTGGGGGQHLPAPISAVLDAAVCTFYCGRNVHITYCATRIYR